LLGTNAAHSIKGFVIPTKSFVKIGITKTFCYNNKMFSFYQQNVWLLQQNFLLQQLKIYLLLLIVLPQQNIFFPCTLAGDSSLP